MDEVLLTRLKPEWGVPPPPGTVLGTDLRLVRLADLDADTSLEDMLSSDSFAADVAGQHGTDLLVEL